MGSEWCLDSFWPSTWVSYLTKFYDGYEELTSLAGLYLPPILLLPPRNLRLSSHSMVLRPSRKLSRVGMTLFYLCCSLQPSISMIQLYSQAHCCSQKRQIRSEAEAKSQARPGTDTPSGSSEADTIPGPACCQSIAGCQDSSKEPCSHPEEGEAWWQQGQVHFFCQRRTWCGATRGMARNTGGAW